MFYHKGFHSKNRYCGAVSDNGTLLLSYYVLRGHPYMTSTQRGRGVNSTWTSMQKIKIRGRFINWWAECLFLFSQDCSLLSGSLTLRTDATPSPIWNFLHDKNRLTTPTDIKNRCYTFPIWNFLHDKNRLTPLTDIGNRCYTFPIWNFLHDKNRFTTPLTLRTDASLSNLKLSSW